ncbi:DUF7282 domain-containing protein [Halobacterium litoreum]|uniref:BGTF surface domain-containing protein n=1 Tax=Halobacterium litoreum TaxID=2039234 RepID=A0ABD5NGZ5_9EURY|nr:BGTF surface domain-containing protein [Halobacterium litoreum]UHH12847.1 hypothetical protein LT972_11850 [Halobacterium litoreum]
MTRTATVVALVVLVVASLAAGPAVAATAQPDSASFGDNYVVVTRGDTTEITVSHSGPANLTIGSQETGFEVRVPLGGSGTDTIEFDTYETTAPNPSGFLSTNGELLTRPLDESIEAGQYDLRVTMDGDTQAVGNLEVEPREDTTSRPGVAPDELDFEESNPSNLAASVTERGEVARGDYAAFVVNESGLEWALDGSSTDATMDSALTTEVTELDPEPNTVPDTFEVDYVVSQVEERDRFVLFWDTSDVAVHGESNNTYELRVTMTEQSELVSEDQTLVEERVRVVEPVVALTAQPSFTLAPWDDGEMRVRGETNLAPSSSLDVRALQQSPSALLWRHVVDVSADGTFSASFDFTEASEPNDFPLWVLDYRDESEQTVELTVADGGLSFADQQVEEGSVEVTNVSLSHGGFVRLSANDTTLGVSPSLSAGDHGTVSVPLVTALNETRTLNATAYADANRNGRLDDADVPYNVSGSVIRDSAAIAPAPNESVGNETTTNRTTTPNETTRTPTGTTLQVDEAAPLTRAPEQSGGGSSGGAVPLSPLAVLVALAAGASLAWRR